MQTLISSVHKETVDSLPALSPFLLLPPHRIPALTMAPPSSVSAFAKAEPADAAISDTSTAARVTATRGSNSRTHGLVVPANTPASSSRSAGSTTDDSDFETDFDITDNEDEGLDVALASITARMATMDFRRVFFSHFIRVLFTYIFIEAVIGTSPRTSPRRMSPRIPPRPPLPSCRGLYPRRTFPPVWSFPGLHRPSSISATVPRCRPLLGSGQRITRAASSMLCGAVQVADA